MPPYLVKRGQEAAGYIQLDGAGNLLVMPEDGATIVAGWIAGSNPPYQFNGNLNVGYTAQSGDFSNATTGDQSTGTGFGISTLGGAPIKAGGQLAEFYLSAMGAITNGTTGGTVSFSIYRNTTGVPSAGTSVGSDTLIVKGTYNVPTANGIISASIQALNSSLAAGTTYYYYLALSAGASQTATLKSGNQSSIYGLNA